ncbi:putative pectate lyase 2 [Drosera capensis]
MVFFRDSWRSISIPVIVIILLAFVAPSSFAKALARSLMQVNAIDLCWRGNPNWSNQRQQLAMCSVGFAGKMKNNIGNDVSYYVVTDPSDDAVDPKPGTLRYGVTRLSGKTWITFKRDMNIKLEKPLLVGSFTTIDGRGTSIHIARGGCFMLDRVTNVIIHGLRFHHCEPQTAGDVMGPGAKLMRLGATDGDAIRVVASTKVWIDHNTLYKCEDGLIDVTLGSTNITISNNWFRDHDKVMLLGHADDFHDDKNMKVTVVFNHFGPNCNQRMPRVRWGYAHVVNNLYQGWEHYAIGGSMNPSIKSEANLFVAPPGGKKEVRYHEPPTSVITSRLDYIVDEIEKKSWNFQSVRDYFENGALFRSSEGQAVIKPGYTKEQEFEAADARALKCLTRSAGALRCHEGVKC